jgi:signal transduction histidine kinase
MKAGSLRLRLLLAAAIAITAALFAAGFALTTLFEQEVSDRVMQELDNDLLQLAGALAVAPGGEVKVTRTLADPRFDAPFSGRYWRIEQEAADSGGAPREVARSRSLWDLDLAAGLVKVGPDGETLVSRVRDVELKDGSKAVNLTLAIYAHDDEITSPVKRFRNRLMIYLSLIGTALIVAAWAQVSIGLRPLQALRHQVALLRQHDAKRLEGEFPTEVEPLVSEFNDVLKLRDTSLERARRRAGDLAHGLMTPLTVLSGIARELKRRNLGSQAQEIDEQVEQMRGHVERGLVRARLSTGRGHELTALAPVVEKVFSTLKRLPRGDVLQFNNRVPAGVLVPVERNDLLELLGNLLDNARKYCSSRVDVSFENQVLVIGDDGPGVPENALEAIRQRGRRLDESRKGFGLGLAIVEDIADIYEIQLSYGKAPLGGLQVNLSFRP